MKRITYKFTATHVFNNGVIMTDDQFKADPVFSGNKNIELANECAMIFDPNYRAMKRAERRFQLVAQRKKELEEQQAKIKEELSHL